MGVLIYPGSKPGSDTDGGKPAEQADTATNRGTVPGKKSIDNLLKRINPDQNAVRGKWRFDGDTLVSPAMPFSLLQVPVTPPESYVLRATVEAAAIDDCLSLGLVVGNTQVTIVMNGWKNTVSGMQLVDLRMVPANETKTGPVLTSGIPNQIVCTVTAGHIEATCNGKPFLNWAGDFNRLLGGPDWEPPNKRQLYLGTYQTSYRITRLELEPLSPASAGGTRTPPATGTTPPPEQPDSLTVLSAEYGSGAEKVDLTERLQKVAQNGLLVVFVEPTLLGGRGKPPGELALSYRIGNQTVNQKFRHREFVFLDARKPPEVPRQGLAILDTFYGAGALFEGRMVDVRQQLVAQVRGNAVRVPVRALITGIPDPAFGTSKVLIVRHAFNGQVKTSLFEEHQTVELGETGAVTGTPLPPGASPRQIIERILQINKYELYVKTESSPQWITVKVPDDAPPGNLILNQIKLERCSVADLQMIGSFAIESLSLNGKEFTDEHLATLPRMKSVMNLFLTNLACSDAGLEHVTRCPGLVNLYLTSSNCSPASLKSLQEAPKLVSLTLIGTDADDEHVAALAGNPRLKRLELLGGSATGAGFRNFQGKPPLDSLNFSPGVLDVAGCEALAAGVPDLKMLNIHNSPFKDDTLLALKKLERLEALQIARTQVTDAGLDVLPALKNLRVLDLGGTQVTGAGFAKLKGKLQNLKYCVLAQTRLDDQGLAHLVAAAPQIDNLMLDSTSVTDDGLKPLPNLKSLRAVHLRHTQIGDAGLKHLKKIPQVQNLYLPKDRFSEAALKDLRESLPKCIFGFE